MKKTITLLVLIFIMIHAEFAIAHYYSGSWFVAPSNISISIIIFFHVVFIASEINQLIRPKKAKK